MENSTITANADRRPNQGDTPRAEATDGGRLLLSEGKSSFDYSYRAVAGLARKRRELPAARPRA